MEKRTQLVVGGVLVAAGLGAGAYVLEQYLKSRASSAYLRNVSIATSPPMPLSAGVHEVALIISFDNPTAKQVTYGVQAATVQGGVITGRWWNSLDVARTAVQAYNAGNITGVELMAQNALYRVPYVQVGAGQRGQITLYELLGAQAGQEIRIWIQPANGGRLLANDALGRHVTDVQSAQFTAKVQVR